MAGFQFSLTNLSFRATTVPHSSRLLLTPCISFPKLASRFKKLSIVAFTSNDIKVGSNIEVDGAPWRVLGATIIAHDAKLSIVGKRDLFILGFLEPVRVNLDALRIDLNKPGKGAAFVRTKMRNYLTGNTVEKTFRAGTTIAEADILKETKQYTYKDGSQFVFMDLSSFEESRLSEADIGDKKKWLKEGMDCSVLLWNGKVIDCELPITVKLTVVEAEPGVRGDTAQGGSKPVAVDTGAVVSVPLFVNIGDEILVDTRTGQYMSRA